jgi:hypothetical protein
MLHLALARQNGVTEEEPTALPWRHLMTGGRPREYDWDAFSGAMARRVYDHGMPESQSELVRDMLD